MIYKTVIHLSVKRHEFKEELLSMWFKCRINKLLDACLNISELYKDTEFEHLLQDIDGLDVDVFTRSVFHERLEYLYKVITTDSQKTRWLFHIFGFDPHVLNHLIENMRKNYIRGYVTVTYDSDHDAYLIGYIFLENGGQHMHDVLGLFSYVW